MRVAIAQINPTVGALKKNLEKAAGFLRQAQEQSADVVVFPELSLCGYPPEDLLLKPHFIKDNLKQLREFAALSGDQVVITGFVDADKRNNIYNAAALIHKRGIRGVYHKMDLPNYGVFDEKRYFQAGRENVMFKTRNNIFGINICEDIWSETGAFFAQAKAGAQVIFNISASPYSAGKIRDREKLLKKRALQAKAYICYANLVGGQDELVFDGGSFVISPQGKIVARAKQFAEDLIFADLNLDRGKSIRSKIKTFSIDADFSSVSGKTEILKSRIKALGKTEEIWQALVLGTRDYVLKNGFKKTVIGLSGGIDSALTAAIAAAAIGPENVIGVTMPSRFTSQETLQDARILAENLKIKILTIPIEDIFAAYLKTLKPEFSGAGFDTTEENLQARIRGNILMAFSNKFGWLVLTTGNKSETSVGYCTLYGDMAGGFAVIKDVPKTLVYKLAEFVNQDQELIPAETIKRAPTAELKPDQKDQDSLPPYPVLDEIVRGYVEENRAYKGIIKKNIRPEDAKKIIRLIDINEYKRRQSPPGVKITPRAFGKDRRFPITNGYQEFNERD